MAEDIGADGLLSLCSTKSIIVSELDGLFSLCSLTSNSHVSLDFCLEKNASIFLVFFGSKKLVFYCSFSNYGTFFLVNKNTSAKFTCEIFLLLKIRTMATNFSPCKGSYVLNQFPSNVMFGMNGFHVSASGAIQGHHGPFVFFFF